MNPYLVLVSSLVGGLSLASGANALPVESTGMLLFPPAVELRASASPPLRLAERAGAVPLATLRSAAETATAELAEMAAWNQAGRKPTRNGFARALGQAAVVELGAGLAGRASGPLAGGLFERRPDGSLLWGTEVTVAGAHRLRLHLADVDLPAGTLLWVYGAEETVGPFGLELKAPRGYLWTPSVGGGAIRLEILVPAGAPAGRFVLDRVLELFRLGADGAPLAGMSIDPRGDTSCLVDAQCVNTTTFDVINLVQQAIAHIQFVNGYLGFLCTGGLHNDLSSSGIPYFLTANHCLDEQDSAATIEAFWNYYTDVCNGVAPSLGSLPRSNGSILLASSASSDYTLVRLNNIPTNRVFLGWNANVNAADHNTILHRVSHPLGLHQHYSRNHVDELFSAPGCEAPLPRPHFLYETFFPGMGDQGGTFGGSSGAPAIIAGGQTVGQLFGACGPDPGNGCDYDNREIDGAFSSSFPDGVRSFLLDTQFLLGGRFTAEMEWFGNPPNNVLRPARVGPGSTDNAGNFYFLNPNNSEVLVKVLNSCSFNNRFWVFAAATTNVEYTITVTDTQSQQVKTYFNPLGNPAAPIQDTAAFATCP